MALVASEAGVAFSRMVCWGWDRGGEGLLSSLLVFQPGNPRGTIPDLQPSACSTCSSPWTHLWPWQGGLGMPSAPGAGRQLPPGWGLHDPFRHRQP